MPTENESLTSYFINYYMVFGAGCSLVSPILIIDDDNMTKDTIDVHTVLGLGLGLGIGMESKPVGYECPVTKDHYVIHFTNG